MIKVGITGGIGTGKSSVSNMIKDMNIPVIDADVISREVMNIYPEILQKIKNNFGEGFFDYKGNLMRRQLGNFIFKYPSERKALEDIVIPYIKEEIFKRFKEYEEKEYDFCVLDAPTLIENNLHEVMDYNILVWVDKKTQIERVRNRDNLSIKDIENRISSQISLDEKQELVDFIIDNTASLSDTKEQLELIIHSIRKS